MSSVMVGQILSVVVEVCIEMAVLFLLFMVEMSLLVQNFAFVMADVPVQMGVVVFVRVFVGVRFIGLWPGHDGNHQEE